MKLSEILATRPELDHEIELEPGDLTLREAKGAAPLGTQLLPAPF